MKYLLIIRKIIRCIAERWVMKKKIKMRIVDFWHDDTEENFYKSPFVKLLESKIILILSSMDHVSAMNI